MRLPNYVKHVSRPNKKDGVWCGTTDTTVEFKFAGLDRVVESALSEGRFLACAVCVKEATVALSRGTQNMNNYPHTDRVQEICRELHKKHQFSSRIATDDELFKELVALGPAAVPALLYRIDQFQEPWDGLAIWEPLIALSEITHTIVHQKGEDGRLKMLIERRLDWGEANGHYERIKWED